MRIVLTKTKDEFIRIPSELLLDKTISFKAKGLLCLLLSKGDVSLTLDSLIKLAKSDKEEIFSAFKELEGASYLTKVKNDDWVISIYDYKQNKSTRTQRRTSKSRDSCPYGEIMTIISSVFPDWNMKDSDHRAKLIRSTWLALNKDLDLIEKLFKTASESDFLMSRNGHKFKGKVNSTWVMKKYAEILDGKYSNSDMEWAKKSQEEEVYLVGHGKTKIIIDDNYKDLGTDEQSGLRKYIKKT